VADFIKLKWNDKACSRTKNRIREHGPLFRVLQARNSTLCLGNRAALMLEAQTRRASDGKGGRESWQGWLPLEEVEVEPALPDELTGRTFSVR
jgi:hypothetical protein|tara:strand:+ start:339 stop:617 length:279 start_codon:yes stop_codon:yes gene_type:complete